MKSPKVIRVLTTAEIADRRAALLVDLQVAREALGEARVRAAELHAAGGRVPDDLVHKMAAVGELETVLAGYDGAAARAEFRELGQRIGLDENDIAELDPKITELDAAHLAAVKAQAPIIDGKVDIDAYHVRVHESRAALLTAQKRRETLRDRVMQARTRRAELQEAHGQLLDALWVAHDADPAA